MIIKKYRSATISITSNSFKVLIDPWLTDGEYYGSWFHTNFFNLDKYIDEINSHNAIYISHIHPDHCSEDTLKKINKSMPIYIHNFHKKFLKLKLERLGFKVFELDNGVRTEIGNNFFLSIFAADDCNPELCYKFIGCSLSEDKNVTGSQQIDTISVIDDNKNVIVNVNDCPYDLSRNVLQKIKNKFEKVDLLLTGYNGAGPYPQCILNFDIKEKLLKAKQKKNYFLNQAYEFVQFIKPAFFSLFAGEYLLGGKLVTHNKFSALENYDNSYSFIKTKLNKLFTKNNILAHELNDEVEYELTSEKIKSISINNKIKKIRDLNSLKNKKFTYEFNKFPEEEELYELSKKAAQKYSEYMEINMVKVETDIYIKMYDKYLFLNQLNRANIKVCEKNNIYKNSSKYILIDLDERLLKNILIGPRLANWNNAEVGSHLNFLRSPEKYERSIYYSLNSFHC